MEPFKPKKKRGPEAIIQDAVIKMLRGFGWFVKPTHGNMYQSGFPDLFCCHSKYGQRWVEIKKPDMRGSRFTAAQLEDFPKLSANGSGVWILTSDSEGSYRTLFGPPNWQQYLLMQRI